MSREPQRLALVLILVSIICLDRVTAARTAPKALIKDPAPVDAAAADTAAATLDAKGSDSATEAAKKKPVVETSASKAADGGEAQRAEVEEEDTKAADDINPVERPQDTQPVETEEEALEEEKEFEEKHPEAVQRQAADDKAPSTEQPEGAAPAADAAKDAAVAEKAADGAEMPEKAPDAAPAPGTTQEAPPKAEAAQPVDKTEATQPVDKAEAAQAVDKAEAAQLADKAEATQPGEPAEAAATDAAASGDAAQDAAAGPADAEEAADGAAAPTEDGEQQEGVQEAKESQGGQQEGSQGVQEAEGSQEGQEAEEELDPQAELDKRVGEILRSDADVKKAEQELREAQEKAKHRARLRAQHQQRRNSAFIGYQETADPLHNIVLTTKLGTITIRPRVDISPITVAMVTALAAHPHFDYGSFIRNEPIPEGWGNNGFFGPPYALLGGTLRTMDSQTPMEGNPVVRRGDVAMIPGSMDFFIALADHPEWGTAHTVWGHVLASDALSWETINKVPTEPYVNNTEGGITTRWLEENSTVPFKVSLQSLAPLGITASSSSVAAVY